MSSEYLRATRHATRHCYLILSAALVAAGCSSREEPLGDGGSAAQSSEAASPGAARSEGQNTFRFDTYGNESFWTDTLRMHEVVEQSVSPTLALSVGLRVDAAAIPADLAAAIKAGQVDMESPATTVALLKLNAVVGLQGTVEQVGGTDRLVKLGVTCALCHSTVDNSFLPGVGARLDGWPNGALNVGAIIALSPALTAAQKAVYSSWGPGKYDPRYSIDGLNTPLVLPPAYGLRGITNETFTAEGPISYWNAYVAVTQMHGRGNFSDPRLGIAVTNSPDLVTSKLPALSHYQLGLATPRVPDRGLDRAAAERGKVVFDRTCASCHVGGSGTDNNAGVLHAPSETGMDPAYAARTTTKMYRTTPLRGLVLHPPYFHDGSAASLPAVVEHYNRVLQLRLTAQQRSALVEYLKTL